MFYGINELVAVWWRLLPNFEKLLIKQSEDVLKKALIANLEHRGSMG